MRIKQLELVGFKSFLDKTRFVFNAPMTSVVGPNGCGKSNIVDALKWVTGELSFKELRGKVMEDLIFAGSELRPPTSMMEVKLTLDNQDGLAPAQFHDYPEISVTRRIFRDGSSEFFLNKTACRLRDITDLFLDTGIGVSSYSIIEQGKVGMIVSSRPEDRRLIIEEAAGITKFKSRKKAALRKMDQTRQNLLRVQDILQELRRQINSLKRQAAKAERYKEVREKVKDLDLSILTYEFFMVQNKLNHLEREFSHFAQESQVAETDLNVRESECEQIKLAVLSSERELETFHEQLFALRSDVQKLENVVNASSQDVVRLRGLAEEELVRADQLKTQQTEISQRIELRDISFQSVNSELAAVESQLLSEKQIEAGLRQDFSQVEQRLLSEQKSYLSHVGREAELSQSLQAGTDNIKRVCIELYAIRQKSDEVAQELVRIDQQFISSQQGLQQAVQLKFNFEQNQSEIENDIHTLRNERDQRFARIANVSERIEGQRSRLDTLEVFIKTFEGYNKGVRAVMHQSRTQEGNRLNVLGILGELLIADKGYEKAVQAALADMIECLVVDNPTDALAAIAFLRNSENKGKASFICNSMEHTIGVTNDGDHPAVKGRLIDYVEFKGGDSHFVRGLLSEVVVVEDLETALVLFNQGLRKSMVTRLGDRISRLGVISGGDSSEEKGILEIHSAVEELKSNISTAELEKSKLEDERLQADHQLAQLEVALQDIKRSLLEQNDRASEKQKDFSKLEEAKKFTQQELEQSKKSEEKLVQETIQLENAREQSERLHAEVMEVKSRAEQLLSECQSQISEHKLNLGSQGQKVTQLQITQASLSEKLESLGRERLDLAAQLSAISNQENQLREKSVIHSQKAHQLSVELEELKESLQVSIVKCTVQEDTYKQLKSVHDEKLIQLSHLEQDLRALRLDRDERQDRISNMKLALQDAGYQVQRLCEQAKERYEANLLDVVHQVSSDVIADELIAEKQSQLNELKDKLVKMGDVHIGAIEELRESEQRHDFIDRQRDDLELSLTGLREAIRKIEATVRDRFIATFEAVNDLFKDFFPKLFKGGKAKLVLTDPDNLLETGVDIVGQPPGKKLQNMNLMSGGEKALTAIALIFSIFKFKTPPFCVLDEVDAPLDDINVGRFVGLIREMSSSAQFIVITHNKITMEAADNLYGITMEEPGVSKVVSVSIQDGKERVVGSDGVLSQISSVG